MKLIPTTINVTRSILLMILLFSLPVPIQAQTLGPTLPPEAQTAFERGLSAARQEDWELAVKYFSQAQKAAPESPQALFNLALASARAEGRDLPAMAWFRAYLAAAPNAPNAEQVRKQILDLEVKVEGTIGKLFRTARETAAGITDDYWKSAAYGKIAEAQAKAGDIAGARETAAGITDVYWKSEAYREIAQAQAGIAKAQAKAGDVTGARQSVALARETAAGITDDLWKSAAYGKIAEAQAEAGDIAGARETAAGITDDLWKSWAYSKIAEAQAQAGDIKGAKDTAAQITDAGHKSSAYKGIASAEAKMGDKARVRETTTQMQYEASAEIKSWTNLAIACQQKRLLTDFLESLKGKPPRDIAKGLAEAARDIALALKKLRDEEVKWQALRAKSTRQPGQSESRPKKR